MNQIQFLAEQWGALLNSSSSRAKFHLWKWHPANTSHITIEKKGFLHCCSQPNCPCPDIPTIQLCGDTQSCKTSACPGDKCVEKLCGNSEQGLGGAAALPRHSQLSAGSCTCSKLMAVTSSSWQRQPLNPKSQPVWHWVCLNCDPFICLPGTSTTNRSKREKMGNK